MRKVDGRRFAQFAVALDRDRVEVDAGVLRVIRQRRGVAMEVALLEHVQTRGRNPVALIVGAEQFVRGVDADAGGGAQAR